MIKTTLEEVLKELRSRGFQESEIQELIVKGSCETRNYTKEEADYITSSQTIKEYSLYRREELWGEPGEETTVDRWTLSHRNTGRTEGSFWGEEIIDHQW